MPLHLSQHKSYHPYNQANRERVQRDQARTAQQEAEERQTSFARKDEARIEALRSSRNGVESTSTASSPSHPPTTTFKQRSGAGDRPTAAPGHSLLRPDDELKPWYTSPHLRNRAEARKTEDQRLQDAYNDSTVKSSHDPLKAMESFLARRKAAKHLPTSSASSSPHSRLAPDQYEPEAVRAAQARRTQPHSSPDLSSRRHRHSTKKERDQDGVEHRQNSGSSNSGRQDRERTRSSKSDRRR